MFLDLCEPCQQKQKSAKKGIVKPIISPHFNNRCQVDLIDYQSQPDARFRFLLVYKDHLSKFVILKPLTSKRVDEVAYNLLDIFLLFGAPSILHSDKGREFCNKILESMTQLWPEIKMVNGKPRHSQSQGSVERANQDVGNMLTNWMSDNHTNNWSEGVRFVQFMKNRAHHAEIKTSPYEAMFGYPAKVGLSSSIIPQIVLRAINTEEDLEKLEDSRQAVVMGSQPNLTQEGIPFSPVPIESPMEIQKFVNSRPSRPLIDWIEDTVLENIQVPCTFKKSPQVEELIIELPSTSADSASQFRTEPAKALMDNKKKNVVHRRKWLTLEEKLKIIEANDNGKTSTVIAREQGMNESSVRSILRKKDFYKSLGTSTAFHRFKSFARHRSLLLDKVEKQLIAWIEDNNQKRIQLTETEIQRKALLLFNELKPGAGCTEKFSASRGWFYRFKNRINLQNCIISGEKPAPDAEGAEEFRSEFVKIVEDGGYTHHQIFNVEETSLYWKRMPSQSFLLEGEKNQPGYKPSKHSLTLLLGSNAAGDLKLKPMIVYRSETPSALRDCEKDSLPVTWRSNKKAWLTKELFEEWFTNYFCPTVERYCHDQGLEFKILLLLDSTPSHDVLDLNKDVKVVFLPQYTASLLQPMTLGVFPILKANYLRQILSQAVSCATPDTTLREFWCNYNIKNAIDNIFKCWCETSADDLAASWHQLLPEVKVRDFEAQVAAIAQDVVTMGQYLGLKTIDVQKVQSCIDSTLQDLDSPVPEFEEVICKEEMPDMYEDEDQECDQELNTEDLEKILQNIDAACETIAASDLDIERSIKVRQMLQNGIQPYRDLYLERNKKKM